MFKRRKIIRTDQYWHGLPCHCSFPVQLYIYVLIKEYLQSGVSVGPSPLIGMRAGWCRVRSAPAPGQRTVLFQQKGQQGPHRLCPLQRMT